MRENFPDSEAKRYSFPKNFLFIDQKYPKSKFKIGKTIKTMVLINQLIETTLFYDLILNTFNVIPFYYFLRIG